MRNGEGGERPWRVLLVDDNLVTLRLMAGALRHEGVEATALTDAEKAIALARASRFDVMFLDLQMRPVNGLEILRRIDGTIPCRYILTGFADAEQEREALRLGAAAVLHKPLDLDRLLALIREPCQPGPG